MAEPLVRYYVAISLDGFVAPPDGSVVWFDEAKGVGDGEAGGGDGFWHGTRGS